jgi:hypothetical protein
VTDEEALAADAARSTHERQRAIHQVGQHPLADALVEAREVELGDADVGIEHPPGVGQLHARDAQDIRRPWRAAATDEAARLLAPFVGHRTIRQADAGGG